MLPVKGTKSWKSILMFCNEVNRNRLVTQVIKMYGVDKQNFYVHDGNNCRTKKIVFMSWPNILDKDNALCSNQTCMASTPFTRSTVVQNLVEILTHYLLIVVRVCKLFQQAYDQFNMTSLFCTYMYVCVCVCACVCERERGRVQ